MLPPEPTDSPTLLDLMRAAQDLVERWTPSLAAGDPAWAATIPLQASGDAVPVSDETLGHWSQNITEGAAVVGIAAAEIANQNDWLLEVSYPVDGHPSWMVRRTQESS